MKRTRLILLCILPLCGLSACFFGDQSTTTDAANDAAGTGDPHEAREVSGVWLLSTDYNYDQRCNYLPVEFVRNLFKLGESVELEKYDMLNGCEVRWGGEKVTFSFEKDSPYESTFQSEYAFDRLFQPQRVAERDSAALTLGVKEGSYHGPNPEGTAAERPESGIRPGGGVGDASADNDSSNHPLPNLTPAMTKLVTPAQNTPTGVALNGVGDKAIWEPRKRTLHVLYLNHIMHVTAPVRMNERVAREGAVNLATAILGRLNNKEA